MMAVKNIASGARSGMFARSSMTSTLSSTPRRSAISPVKSTAFWMIGTETDDSCGWSNSDGSAPKVSS